jgi:hypothetical protein
MSEKCLFLLIETVSPTYAYAVGDRVFFSFETCDFYSCAHRAESKVESSPTHTGSGAGREHAVTNRLFLHAAERPQKERGDP